MTKPRFSKAGQTGMSSFENSKIVNLASCNIRMEVQHIHGEKNDIKERLLHSIALFSNHAKSIYILVIPL